MDVTWRDKLWFVWTFAPEQSATKERWPQDAEDLSQCLSQQQTLQRKEEEEIPKCLTMYEQCLHGSIHLLHQSNHPSIHACMHACVHPVGKAQTNRFTDVCAKGYLDWRGLPFLSDEFCYGPWQCEYQGSSLAQFQDSFLCNFAKYE